MEGGGLAAEKISKKVVFHKVDHDNNAYCMKTKVNVNREMPVCRTCQTENPVWQNGEREKEMQFLSQHFVFALPTPR